MSLKDEMYEVILQVTGGRSAPLDMVVDVIKRRGVASKTATIKKYLQILESEGRIKVWNFRVYVVKKEEEVEQKIVRREGLFAWLTG